VGIPLPKGGKEVKKDGPEQADPSGEGEALYVLAFFTLDVARQIQ
jgi:hypothetical protein